MSLSDRRRPAFTADLFVRVGLVWLVVAVIFVATKWHAIAALQLPDADDSLRLVQLRDLVAGQGWFDLTQYRVDPPHGMPMHWSRLVDAPLLLVYSTLAPLFGPVVAERVTLVVVPLITLFSALLLTGRLAWRMLGEQAIAYACLVMALATAVTGQLQPLRIDHHGWQIVAVLAALNGLAARSERTGGRVAGVALGLGMTISLELLPIAALFGGVLALRWLFDPKAKALCLHYVRALAATSLLAFAATRGLSDFTPYCDTLSSPYLAALVASAGGLTLLGLAPPLPRPALALGMIACAGAGVAALLTVAPQCSSGPFVMLDPLVQTFWYSNIREGMPVWQQDFSVALRLIVLPLFGLYAAAALWQRSSGWLRRFWFEYLLIAAGTLVLALVVSRAAGFAAAVAAVPVGGLLREWHRKAQTIRRPAKRTLALAATVLVVMPDLPLLLAKAFNPARAAPIHTAQFVCDIPVAAATLNRLAPATVFAPIDNGPMLLLTTRHKVVATAHHRAPAALHDVIAAFTADPDKAEALVRAHGAGFVAICPGLAEAQIYREAAPNGLMAKLSAGQAPDWLRPVYLPMQSGLKLWQVLPR